MDTLWRLELCRFVNQLISESVCCSQTKFHCPRLIFFETHGTLLSGEKWDIIGITHLYLTITGTLPLVRRDAFMVNNIIFNPFFFFPKTLEKRFYAFKVPFLHQIIRGFRLAFNNYLKLCKNDSYTRKNFPKKPLTPVINI